MFDMALSTSLQVTAAYFLIGMYQDWNPDLSSFDF